MTIPFPNLFSPLDIGGMTLKNRVFIPGHATRLVEADGTIGERILAYHRARVQADVAMIITEVNCVHRSYLPPNRLSVADDDCIPGLKKLADLGKPYDCRIIGQLFHPGRVAGFSADGSIMATYAPSEVPDEFNKNVPSPLSTDEIWEMIKAFGDGAGRMAEAGLDGVELLASMGYLISQFLNPRTNHRKDEFGGSAENRLRFLREIISSVRLKVGNEVVVGIRVSADEMDEVGLQPHEVIDTLKTLDRDGELDYYNVITATTASYDGYMHIVPHMVMPTAYIVPHASAIKAVVSKPVLVAGRITQPQEAERVISRCEADMIGLVRAHICDPEFTKKAKAGHAEDIRACIGCNQACIGHGLKGFFTSCIQHPETGRELEFERKRSRKMSGRVLVVGGGPAGMKAAVTVAQLGHRVTLFERGSELGGQVLLAKCLPDRSEFGGLVTNFSNELDRSNVEIVKQAEMNAKTIASMSPDEVIVATGAEPSIPQIEGLDEMHVVDSWSVICGEANVGQSVVIWDWRSDWVGLGLAQMLAQNGCNVRLAVNGIVAGERIPSMVRDYAVGELHKLGVEIVPYVRLFGADSDSVYFQHVTSNRPVIMEAVDTLVSHHAPRRNAAIFDELKEFGIKAHLIGDALNPRTVEEAVLEGLRAGFSVLT